MPDPDETIIFQADNPKRIGSKSYLRYERYKHATSIRQALTLGAAPGDIKHDFEKGFLKAAVASSQAVGQDESEDDVVVIAEPISIDPPAVSADSSNQAEPIIIDPDATSAESSNQAEPIIIDPPGTSPDSSNQEAQPAADEEAAHKTAQAKEVQRAADEEAAQKAAQAEEAQQAAEEAAQKAAQAEVARRVAEAAARRAAEESAAEETQQAAQKIARQVTEEKAAQEVKKEPARTLSLESVQSAEQSQPTPARTLSSESMQSESAEQSQPMAARTFSSESMQSESEERCMICLTVCRCAHIAVHGNRETRCGPHAVCLQCAKRVVETSVSGSGNYTGQFKCPICKRSLGTLRRAMSEGSRIHALEEAVSTPLRRKQNRARDVHCHSANAAASFQGAESASGSSKKARKNQDFKRGHGIESFQPRPDIRPLIWEFPDLGSSD